MSNVALIDGDIVAYRCAATCKGEDPSEIACIRADSLIRQILETLGCPDYWLFLSGQTNFRYAIYPNYKANRRDVVRPKWLQPTREYLCVEWRADVTDGIEADDAIGIKHTELTAVNFNPIICSLDKDFRQIAGEHYNFVKEELSQVSELDAIRNFYKQLVLGDKGDHIPGFDGVFRQKPTIYINTVFDEIDLATSPKMMYNIVRSCYKTPDLMRNAQCLYIRRKEGEEWEFPTGSIPNA